MPLTDTAIRNAKPKDKQYRLSDERGLYPRSLFPHFFILAGKGISFDPMVANTFLLCEDGFHEIYEEYAKQVDEKNG